MATNTNITLHYHIRLAIIMDLCIKIPLENFLLLLLHRWCVRVKNVDSGAIFPEFRSSSADTT